MVGDVWCRLGSTSTSGAISLYSHVRPPWRRIYRVLLSLLARWETGPSAIAASCSERFHLLDSVASHHHLTGPDNTRDLVQGRRDGHGHGSGSGAWGNGIGTAIAIAIAIANAPSAHARLYRLHSPVDPRLGTCSRMNGPELRARVLLFPPPSRHPHPFPDPSSWFSFFFPGQNLHKFQDKDKLGIEKRRAALPFPPAAGLDWTGPIRTGASWVERGRDATSARM
ncbi:hypothetical protein JHW43_003062 [Diplocarpon mali]|nr:hypothetical protein JHW43_003062 [Diplocarpon mali]